jgi:hypothetical protein
MPAATLMDVGETAAWLSPRASHSNSLMRLDTATMRGRARATHLGGLQIAQLPLSAGSFPNFG